jgi:hypothetical protein
LGKSKPFKEVKQQGFDKDQEPKIEFLEVTADSDIRELLFVLVEILRKQGITVTPAEKESLLKHDA